MNDFNQSLPAQIAAMPVMQFAYGKIIQGGLDASGYALVAKSAQLPDEATIRQIRDRASVGQVYDLAAYTGSVVAFMAGEYAVAARFQRSPRQDSRGYFLQEHYVLLSHHHFLELGANFTYLIDLLPDEIPWREQVETLPSLPLPQRNPTAEQQRIQAMWQVRRDQILYVLQLVLDGHLFVISAPQEELANVWCFLEAVSALLPRTCRRALSWGYNVLNLTRSQARLKVAVGRPAGSEGFAFVPLASTQPSRPLAIQNGNTHSYLANLQDYQRYFGWAATAVLLENLPCTLPEDWQALSASLAVSLWQQGGVAMLVKELEAAQRPYSPDLLANIIDILSQPNVQINPEQRVRFLAAVFAGCLDSILPAKESILIPLEINKISDASQLWATLSTLFAQLPTAAHQQQAQAICKTWQENSTFWQRQDTQQFLHDWHTSYLSNNGAATTPPLQYLQRQAEQGLIPLAVQHQASLLNRALSTETQYAPQILLMAWLSMATTPQQAQQVAQQVQHLQNLVQQQGAYAYIGYGLQGYSPDSLDHIFKKRPPEGLAREVNLLLLLAQKGIAWQLAGFTAPTILLTLDAQSENLPSADLTRLVAGLLSVRLTHESRNALALLLLSLGKMEEFRKLVQSDRNWVTFVAEWQARHPKLDNTYHQVVGITRAWFEKGPVNVSYNVWFSSLRQVFANRAALAQNSDAAVNFLTELLLKDAFASYAEEKKRIIRIGSDENKSRVEEVTVAKILYVRRASFPISIPVAAPNAFNRYLKILGEAYASWPVQRLSNHLFKTLRQNGLTQEASYLQNLYIQRRGPAMAQELMQAMGAVQQETKLDDLHAVLQEVTDLSGEEVRAYLNNPQIRQQVADMRQKLAPIVEALRHLDSKL